MPTEISRSDLIAKFGIDKDSLTNWKKEGLPVHKKGAGRRPDVYILEDVEAWCSANKKIFGKEDYNAARTRKERALASMAELDLQEAEGKLVKLDAITTEFEKQLINCKQRLLAVPSKVAGIVIGISDINIIKDIVEKEIHTALEELSK